ncbi:MAG: MFS transporter [Acidobacteriaceae bacterium]|nr:MFS transporter [Acidobacteriaceae bacterium]
MVSDTHDRPQSLLGAPFYAGFVLSGMATVLLGPLLPILGTRWSLTDLQAGLLFAVQFTASTFGAVLASYFSRSCLIFGYASVALGFAALALADYHVALLAFVLLGVGLGSSTTATNLLFGTARPKMRGVMLTRVNLFWGIGAVCCPPFIAASVAPETLRLVLLTLSLGAFAVFGAVIILLSRRAERGYVRSQPDQVSRLSPSVFVLFSALLFLYVGGETSIFGWIGTYASRYDGLDPGSAGLLVSAFWIAIVFGRALTPLLVKRASEFAVLTAGVIAAICGIASLLFGQTSSMTLIAVAVTGMGCAPVFPLTVARLLARIGLSRHAGWIFAICGAGAAVLPWTTGLYSAHAGSLRTAFVVPLAALAAVLILVLIERVLPLERSKPVSVSA